ncbi:MAG TPA: heme exporter protein CcmB [Thermoanaerobaculia bacterium]
MSSSWAAEAAAVFVKDWRCELRTRHAVATLALFALTTLLVASLVLGPIGNDAEMSRRVVPVLVWLIVLFAAAAGLPRAFVHEEESRTAIALRLAARPSAVFAGKLVHIATLVAAIEAIVAPLAVALFDLRVAAAAELVAALAAGGLAIAAATTLLAAIVAQGRGASTLFAVLALPVLLPALALAVAATRVALTGVAEGNLLTLLLLYDGSVVVAGFLLFPAIWNP